MTVDWALVAVVLAALSVFAVAVVILHHRAKSRHGDGTLRKGDPLTAEDSA